MRTLPRLLLLALVLVLAVSGCAAAGSKYPDKAVNIIVPNPPGGLNDLTARALAEAAKSSFSQPLTIVNKPGGGGAVGVAEMVQAKPDGYTIGLGMISSAAIVPQITQAPYKGPQDFVPVMKVATAPVVFAVKGDAPWKTMKEALDWAKANDGKFRVGTPGIGSVHHLDLELTKEKSGANLVHVPFAGGAESSAALLGGHIEGVIIPPSVIIGQVKAGTIKVLGTFEEKRNPLLPDAPTVKEATGYDITLGEYQFIIAPKGTPDSVVAALNDSLKKAMDTDSFKKFALEGGYVIDYKNSAELIKQTQADYVYYTDLTRKLGLKKD